MRNKILFGRGKITANDLVEVLDKQIVMLAEATDFFGDSQALDDMKDQVWYSIEYYVKKYKTYES